MRRKSLLALALFVGLILATAGSRRTGSIQPRESATTVSSAVAAAARAAVGPFDSRQSFIVAGRVDLTVDGNHISGKFDLAFFVEADGRVTLTLVLIKLRDVYTTILGDEEWFRCIRAFNVGPIHGTMDMSGNLTVPVRAVTLSATSYTELGPRGTCPGSGRVRSGLIMNEGPLRGRHDPMANEFKLDGATPLVATIGGRTDSRFALSIPSGGVRVLETEDVGPLTQGSARVVTNVPISVGVIIRSVNAAGGVIFETGYSGPIPTRRFAVLADSIGEAADSGLIILNPSTTQRADLTLRLIDRNGQQVGGLVLLSVAPSKLSTGPNGEPVRFLSDLFSTVPGIDEFEGTIAVSSSIDVSVLAVQRRGERLTILPVF